MNYWTHNMTNSLFFLVSVFHSTSIHYSMQTGGRDSNHFRSTWNLTNGRHSLMAIQDDLVSSSRGHLRIFTCVTIYSIWCLFWYPCWTRLLYTLLMLFISPRPHLIFINVIFGSSTIRTNLKPICLLYHYHILYIYNHWYEEMERLSSESTEINAIPSPPEAR